MTRRYKLELSAEQVVELTEARNHHEKPYVRERAAAILKVGQGQTIKAVAQRGLLRKRKEHAVKEWIVRYQADGIPGLLVRSGRGRKPAFSPSVRGGSQRRP